MGGQVALTPASSLYNQPHIVPDLEIESKVSDNDQDETPEQEIVDLENLALSDPVAYEHYLQVSEG